MQHADAPAHRAGPDADEPGAPTPQEQATDTPAAAELPAQTESAIGAPVEPAAEPEPAATAQAQPAAEGETEPAPEPAPKPAGTGPASAPEGTAEPEPEPEHAAAPSPVPVPVPVPEAAAEAQAEAEPAVEAGPEYAAEAEAEAEPATGPPPEPEPAAATPSPPEVDRERTTLPVPPPVREVDREVDRERVTQPVPPPVPEPAPAARAAVPERAPDVELPRAVPTVLPAPARRTPARIGPVSRRTAALSVAVVAALVTAGAGVAVLGGGDGATPGAAAKSPAAAAPPPAAPGATLPPPGGDVLPALDPAAPVPTAAGLRRVLGPLLRTPGLGTSVSAEVVDLASGASLLSVAPNRPAVPASSAKLLTGAAALALLGPGTRLRTSVVTGATPDEIVLVGGGDVTLAAGRGVPGSATGRAGMADLADATAAALTARGRTAVAVRLDDSLFPGSAVNPAWSPGDVRGGFVAPVTALAVNSGSATPGTPLVAGEPAGRVDDPAMTAATIFSGLLAKRGITVTGTPARARAPQGAQPLAAVESATIADLVEHALTDSDNTVAEALARSVAVQAGRQATFADAGVAVLDRVALLGVPVAGAHLSGGSGLGDGNLVPARTLARLLVLAASPDHPELRPLLSGLPVAGASGTLTDRFTGVGDAGGVGIVRAKTGTLTGASSLSGTVVDADGRMLGFVIEADAVSSTLDARAALDAAAASLAACGCR